MGENKFSRTENIRYIQQMLGELRSMAKLNDLDMLAYLIEIAYIESNDLLAKETNTVSPLKKRNTST
ncbi:hypothetical protein ACTJJ7_24915 [Phyllobacterium sp. 22229]|uniref:Uncharacterized protein n=1 Tax=Phyllobacterium myrsinacearum TaxID=28101 RepID=A0A2S9JZR3_9HYPH|nr:hypothetical protein [Phyllobacterium myrsinacearum]PRD58799.1 hypothetical protein C5750_06915 [Phyllobacterium myrsinacearum]PWV97084.1 hypothetical protein DEV92_1011077 [Phyllobacterium myrsinacearum]RZS88938.1 hypothetical protein EV217_1335 [Phyllobacterium myrsinacearum]RZV08925.1 hypothetical protein EV654_0007 [Phyllobacterium myrsinacearum]